MIRSTTLVAASLALALAACSGGADTPDDAAAPATVDGEVTFVGNDSVQWAQSAVSAVAVDGNLDVTLVCEGAVPHNLVIEGVADEDAAPTCDGNEEATATLAVEAGTYSFYCTIPGHREAGMEGTLTVS